MTRATERKKAPEAWLDLRSPGTFRYALGLGIPGPGARLQSRTPLLQAKDYR